MRRTSTLALILMCFVFANVQICNLVSANPVYQKPGYDEAWIESPQNKTYNPAAVSLSFIFITNFNPPYLSFCYTLDGTGEYLTGPIWEAMMKINQSVTSQRVISWDSPSYGSEPYRPYTEYVIEGYTTLPLLSDGAHNITVYRGPNYPAKNAGYESFGTVYFEVNSSAPMPPPSPPPPNPTPIPEPESKPKQTGSADPPQLAPKEPAASPEPEQPEPNSTPLPSPQDYPSYQEPEQPADFPTTPLFAIAASSVAVVTLGIAAYSIRRKRKSSET